MSLAVWELLANGSLPGLRSLVVELESMSWIRRSSSGRLLAVFSLQPTSISIALGQPAVDKILTDKSRPWNNLILSLPDHLKSENVLNRIKLTGDVPLVVTWSNL